MYSRFKKYFGTRVDDINHNAAIAMQNNQSEVLALYSLAFIAFICLWNFDLGFPADIDLMLNLSAPLMAFTYTYGIQNIKYRTIFRASLIIGAFYSIYWYSSFQYI